MGTVSGLIYNLGLVVGPWVEGQLAQCLLGILNGNETFAAMAALCAGYLIAIAVVQGSRFIKRLYVRKFANNINRSMKQVLYANLVRKDKVELEQAGTGTLMTKAISDVDACAEGMRKFTTEIFDTGIALLAYAVMLLGYDWRLALLCLVFAPISYYIAEQMKTLVQRTGAANKESTGRLSAATLDRVSGALTYRVYGCEPQRDAAYEACLQDYERTAVKAGLPVAAMPPLVLGRVVDRLTARQVVPFALALGYFGLLALSGGLDSLRESLLTVFGQKMTHALRSAMCAKLDKLPAEAFVNQESGAAVSRFVGDVDTVEELFTSGIISMFADACRLCGILAVIFAENRGLALILLVVLPLLYLFTRVVQKRMLKAQLQNRAAVARASAHVPETLRCIRTIHTLRRENYMEKAYDEALDDSFAAVEKTNFYDACYSPVILIMNAAVVALVMLLSAAGSPEVRAFFGMSVGTAVAVIAYISQVFTPLESIGMEIETIQSAVAGVRRINGFLAQAERIPTAETAPQAVPGVPSVELQNVHFGYESDEEVLHGLSFAVQKGEQVTLTGRTGAGKSTIFKLLLGLYRPQQGKVMLNGVEAATLPDTARRPLVGYVEQSFRRVPGTVRDQITLFDAAITPQQAEDAARTVGLHDAIAALPEGYDTPCTPGIFSQGQWQLLSIARAIAAGPQILLLDEITANLDAGTEQTVLDALQRAGQNRTVVSISHRLYNRTGGRSIEI